MNTAVRTLDRPGDAISYTIGRTVITVTWTEPGYTYTVTTYSGTYRVAELCTTHTDESTARKRARLIAESLKAGISVEQLAQDSVAARTGVLAATAQVVNAEAQRITQPSMQVGSAALQPYRPSSQRDVPSLEQVAPDFGHRNTSHLAASSTSNPMDRIIAIAAEGNGRIIRGGHTAGGEASSTQLIALRKRHLVQLTYGMRRNQRVITGGWLTGAGWQQAEALKVGV